MFEYFFGDMECYLNSFNKIFLGINDLIFVCLSILFVRDELYDKKFSI